MKTTINFTIDRHHTAPAFIEAVKEFNREIKEFYTADDLARLGLDRFDASEFTALRCDIESVWTGSSSSAYVTVWAFDGVTRIIQRSYWLHQERDGSMRYSASTEHSYIYGRN